MDVILCRKKIVMGKYSAQSFVVPVAFISLLTVASFTYSAYYPHGEQSRKQSSAHPAMVLSHAGQRLGVDNLDKLDLRALRAQAARLDKRGKQLVGVDKSHSADFSVSWDNVITKHSPKQKTVRRRMATRRLSPNKEPKARQKTGRRRTTTRHLSRHDTTAKLKRSIQIVSRNLLRKYRSHPTNLPAGWPLSQGRVSSKFGKRGRRMHKGLDIAAKRGEPVFAVEDGVVLRSKYVRGYGRLVEIRHGDMYITRYGHNSKNLVKTYDKVYKGQTIALVGSSGRSTGPHVHFEVRQDGVAINPLKYLGAMAHFSLAENVKLSQYVKLSRR